MKEKYNRTRGYAYYRVIVKARLFYIIQVEKTMTSKIFGMVQRFLLMIPHRNVGYSGSLTGYIKRYNSVLEDHCLPHLLHHNAAVRW